MKRVHPFPSFSLTLPEDILEDNDQTVASYWKHGDSCLLQISSFSRNEGPQVSATERLSDQMRPGGEWQIVNLTRSIEKCDAAAASTQDAQGTSWVHVYLVWDWLAVHVTVSRKGDPNTCSWAWDSVFSILPTVM
jgi:hypothetical protein